FAHLQNEVRGNSSSGHSRHSSTVRRLTPTVARSCFSLPGAAPCLSAVIRTTTAATYTRRDRNRNDAGVVRLRQFSSAQQKLRRLEYSSCSSSGAPRGLRGYRALCRFPPHAQPVRRACSARSSFEFQKHSVKTGIIQNRLIQRNRLLHFGRYRRQKPLGSFMQAF